MGKVIKENQRFERLEVSRDEAVSMIKEMNQTSTNWAGLMTFHRGNYFLLSQWRISRSLCW
jgi:hypothetical protein